MIKDILKDAFIEGREVGGEFEDSESYVVSQMLPFFDIPNAIVRQRNADGTFGRTFNGFDEVKEWCEDSGLKFSSSNLQTAICAGWKCLGYKWEIVV